MSTNGTIARANGDGWEGRYHHWDSYPTGLGATLYELGRKWGPDKLCRILIDEHPAGWSTINDKNWKLKPGFESPSGKPGKRKLPSRPLCYCHGERSEEGYLVTHLNAGGEWAYVIDAPRGTMTIFVVIFPTPANGIPWRPLTTLRFSDPAPDWEALDKMQYEPVVPA